MKRTDLHGAGKADAFTFVEVFAAMVFLAILVPAIIEGLGLANRTSVIAERSSIAGELAENKLNEIIVDGTSQVAVGTSGDFGTDWPGYRWELSQQQWAQDTTNTMTNVTMEVFFQVQGAERSVKLDTLVSGSTQIQSGP